MKTYSVSLAALLLLVGLNFNTLAQRGKDGAKTVSAANTLVNYYTILISDALAGDMVVNVASSTLNGSGYFASNLAAGDLIFIIQMQGATITTPDDTTYGTITSYNNCGNNEFAEVQSVPNSTSISVTCGLKNNYTTAGRVQIVRVPRFSSLTINNGGVLTSATWNGSSGGIFAVEVLGNTTINSGGKIDLSAKGFRGGALGNSSQWGVGNFHWPSQTYGAEKGEGIAGFETDYDAIGGRYTRGAAANAGGGGDGHNSGGAGGGNAGDITAWNGWGVPDVSTGSWVNAWNQVWAGFANNNSSGGGQGGYSYSSVNMDATTDGPGNTNWGGDYRRNNGGMGGRPLDYSTGRLFLGGGGGAGDENETKGTAGTNGGGLAYLVSYANVNGSGQIISNGADVPNTAVLGSDGCGGAGAGGTIIVNAQGTVSGVSITANGGKGGNQVIYNLFSYPTEAEGPGGGGGGGYIAISNGTPARTTNGGNNGTTDSHGLLEFPPNGATKGGVGLPNQAVTNYWPVVSDVTVCSGSSANLSVTIAGTPPAGVIASWYNSITGGSPISTGTTFNTPALTTNTTYYVGLCPGYYRVPVNVTVSHVAASFTTSNACYGATTSFTNNSTGSISSYNWNFGDGNSSSSQNPTHAYATSGTYNVILAVTDSAGCTSSDTVAVTIYQMPTAAFSAVNTTGCSPLTVSFTNTSANGSSYSWSFGDGNSSIQTNPVYTYQSSGTYTVTLIVHSSNGCSDTLIRQNYVTVSPKPTASFTANNACLGDTVHFSNTSTGATSYSWSFGDGYSSTAANPFHVYTTANTYTVKLVVSSGGNCNDSITQTITISPAPTASFTANNTSACDSLTVTFTNNSTGTTIFNWNFGDGNSSTATSPTHTYTSPGTYSVTLDAGTGACASSLTQPNLITIYETPIAVISVLDTFVCLGTCTNFTSTSTGSPTSWSWSFPNASTTSSTAQNPTNICYPFAGTYSVSLTVSNAHCSSSQTLTNYIIVDECAGPHANFYCSDTVLCNSGCINFYSTSTLATGYQWIFQGATPSSSTQQNPTNICYSSTGSYAVTLIVSNNFSNDTLIVNQFIQVITASTPSFTQHGDTLLCTHAASYQWYLNGTAISGATSQQYIASTSGNYYVVVNAGTNCAGSSGTTYVTVTGISEISGNDLIYFYPNPFSNNLTLVIESQYSGNARLKMTDAIGKLIFEKDISMKRSYQASFDFSNLAPGVYFVAIETAESKTVRRITKQ